MIRPRRFLVRMVLFVMVVALAAVAGTVDGLLRDAFLTNPPLNGFIVSIFLIGIVFNFRQVIRLYPEMAWIENFRRGDVGVASMAQPHLLASMATMMGERKDRLSLSASAMRSLLDGIASRLDESRDISRYLIGLLIFLGLLGTFWGLSGTIGSIREVIKGLSVGSGDPLAVFENLKRGLEAPLSGMGTAFSSSLFGLAGSLVLGFLDLQAGQAQNRFYNDLEDWLSSVTRLGSGGAAGDGDHAVPAYVQALLEQTAESLENLQRTLARSEEKSIAANVAMVSLSERLGTLTDHMRTEQAVMMKLAENQMELKPLMMRLAEQALPSGGHGMDDATRAHIRNIDVYAARMLEEMSAGRDEMTQQLRSEIKLLARTVAALADEWKG